MFVCGFRSLMIKIKSGQRLSLTRYSCLTARSGADNQIVRQGSHAAIILYRLRTSELIRFRVSRQRPNALKILHIKFRNVRIVNNDDILVIAFLGVGREIQ